MMSSFKWNLTRIESLLRSTMDCMFYGLSNQRCLIRLIIADLEFGESYHGIAHRVEGVLRVRVAAPALRSSFRIASHTLVCITARHRVLPTDKLRWPNRGVAPGSGPSIRPAHGRTAAEKARELPQHFHKFLIKLDFN